ncbi:GNAT family N-acetyltransferase [Leucobacter sp.]
MRRDRASTAAGAGPETAPVSAAGRGPATAASAGLRIRRIGAPGPAGSAQAAEREIEAVSALVRAAYERDYRLDEGYLGEIADVRRRISAAEVWVAEDPGSGALLGTVTVPRPGERLHDDTAEGEMDLRLLGVAHEARGRGVGERLMRHCIDLARRRGASRLVLHTASQMETAWRLYERMGFTRIPEREHHFVASGEVRRLMAYGIAIESGPADGRNADSTGGFETLV